MGSERIQQAWAALMGEDLVSSSQAAKLQSLQSQLDLLSEKQLEQASLNEQLHDKVKQAQDQRAEI